MGQVLSEIIPDADRSNNYYLPRLKIKKEDWPYLWAIRDPDVLDWKAGLSAEDINRIALIQANLPVQVSEGIYLGDARTAHDIERLRSVGITHVLNVAGRHARSPVAVAGYKREGIGYLAVEAEDEEGYRMLARHLKTAVKFYESARKDKDCKVLVHCMAGINRSGVIVCALKMLLEKKVVLDVVAEVRLARGNVCLQNFSFQEELVDLARRKGLLGPAPGQEGCRVKLKGAVPSFGSLSLGDFGLGGASKRSGNFEKSLSLIHI